MSSNGAGSYKDAIENYSKASGGSDALKAAETSPIYASLLGPNADPNLKNDLMKVLGNSDPKQIASDQWNSLINDFKGKDPGLAKSATDLLNYAYGSTSGFPMNGKGVGDLLNADIQNNVTGSHAASNLPSAFANNGGNAVPTLFQDYTASDGSSQHLSDNDWQAINQWMVNGCKDKKADGTASLTLSQYKEVCDAQPHDPTLASYLAKVPGADSLAKGAGKANNLNAVVQNNNAAVQSYVGQYFPAVNDPNNTQAQTLLHVIQNNTQDNKGGITDHDFADCLNQLGNLAFTKGPGGGWGPGSNYDNVVGLIRDDGLRNRLDKDVKYIGSHNTSYSWGAFRDMHNQGYDTQMTTGFKTGQNGIPPTPGYRG